jgi:hypothetical protein
MLTLAETATQRSDTIFDFIIVTIHQQKMDVNNIILRAFVRLTRKVDMSAVEYLFQKGILLTVQMINNVMTIPSADLVQLFRVCIKFDKNLVTIRQDGNRLMKNAIDKNQVEMVRLLMQNGVLRPVDCPNIHVSTAVNSRCSLEIVSILIDNGFDDIPLVDAVANSRKWDLLHTLLDHPNIDHLRMSKLHTTSYIQALKNAIRSRQQDVITKILPFISETDLGEEIANVCSDGKFEVLNILCRNRPSFKTDLRCLLERFSRSEI